MARIESSIIVSKSVEETFDFLSKRESHLHFIPRMVSLTQTSQGEFAQVGVTFEGILNYLGIKIPVKYEIIENVPNQELAMKGSMPYVEFKDGYVVSGQHNGTKITFWLDLIPFGYARILSPVAGLIGKVHAWETLRNLKREING
ncbi:MAG: SRPBCC family protein [Chloroflexota bacterium]